MRTEEQEREYKRLYAAAWRASNPERARQAWKRADDKRRDKRKVSDAARRAVNPELVKEQSRRWYEANTEAAKAKAAAWRAANPERASEQRQEFKARRPHYHQEHNRESENYRIAGVLRACLHGALRKRKRPGADWIANARIGAILACSKPELIAHLEAQFLPGMSWENYGRKGWEIDHVRQCASFDLTKHEQVLECFNYLNLRPLWRSDNLRRPRKE